MKIIFKLGNFLFCSAIFFVAGCGVWQELHFTKNKPNEADLIGTYEADAKTQKLIIKDGGYASSNCQIKVNADGKIAFLEMPDWWRSSFGEPHGKLESTNGIWRVAKSGENWTIVWESENTIDLGLDLIGEKPPYKIHIYVGDPDSQRFMIFERAKK